MTFEIGLVFALIGMALVLFAWERVSYDVTALLVASTLLATGILTPSQGLSGLSNPATVTIACMFVLSEGLRKTGALDHLGALFLALGRRHRWLALAGMMGVVAVISGFINNTAAIAIFIPVVLAVSVELDVSPSKLLMPVSFASMFGGVCTLIGTSTNILVSAIAVDAGLPGFGMFELAPVGLVLAVVGLAYTGLVGVRLIPERRSVEDVDDSSDARHFLTDVVVEHDSRLLGSPLDVGELLDGLDLDVVELFSADGQPAEDRRIEEGSVLRVRGGAGEIQRLIAREDLRLWHGRRGEEPESERALIEGVIAPDSALEGRTIEHIDFPERYGAVVIALRRHGDVQRDRLDDVALRGGDAVLLSVPGTRRSQLERDPAFVLASEIGLQFERRDKLPLALGVLAAVVGLAALEVAPIVVTAVCGVVLLLLTEVLTPEEAYEAISWKVIFLLAGVIPLGTAMNETGASELLTELLTGGLGQYGPRVVLSALFFLSMMLTNVISNQATAALLAPIALTAAQTLGVDARPFLLAITYAASLSFMTPVGYQTNTLVYGPGHYHFLDYTRVGTPLNLLLWAVATVVIPWVWAF